MTATALLMLVLTLLALCGLAWCVLAGIVWIVVLLTEIFSGIRIILSFGEDDSK